ncbi:hypothetical protein HDU78_007811 [Chytriomyces hyalinus]|nr:hypothetical protein HDU78_007811 [Chytriomyces hyalinus]
MNYVFTDGTMARRDVCSRVHVSGPGTVVVAASGGETLRVSVGNVPLAFAANAAAVAAFKRRFYCADAWQRTDSHGLRQNRGFVRWPRPFVSQRAFREGVSCASPKETCITSIDTNVSLSLSLHRLSVSVTVRSSGNSETCTFSTLCVPLCWRYPMHLLFNDLTNDQMMELAHSIPGCVVTSKYVAIPFQPDLDFTKEAPSSSENVAFEPSESDFSDKPLALLGTDSILYRVIPIYDPLDFRNTTRRPEKVVIEATVFSDGTVIRTDESFSFVTLYRNEELQPRESDKVLIESQSSSPPSDSGEMYAIHHTPETCHNWSSGAEYPLREIVSEMTRLYILASRLLLQPEQTQQSTYSQILNEQQHLLSLLDEPCMAHIADAEIPGVGTFHAYSDQSVLVHFRNGVLIRVPNCDKLRGVNQGHVELELLRKGLDRASAAVRDAEGNSLFVRVFKPIGFEREMSHVFQFIDWAFQSKSDRIRMREMKRQVSEVSRRAVAATVSYLKKQ